MFCGQDTLVGVGTDDVVLQPLLCKRWSCDTCMPRRLLQLRALAASGEPTSLLTLTCDPKRYAEPAAAARDLVRCWRLMRQRLTREGYATKIPFIAVVEATKKGWPHLHILLRAPYLPQAYLSHLACAYIGAPIVDIRRVYNRRHASRYIAKYVSKGPAAFEGCKRYWRSQDYDTAGPVDQPVADRGRSWWRERCDWQYLLYTLQNCDWHHRNEEGKPVVLEPGPEARWLWFEHDPPPLSEVSKCQPLSL